ncbi:hypothetical protein BsWGS_02716 [Bradybaena similaris]
MPKLGRRGEFSTGAPFGTDGTPTYSPRLIGGNFINVLEEPVNISSDSYNSHLSEKPNNIDPRALIDFTRRYNQPYQDPFHKRSDFVRPTQPTKRPDSKDISSRYPRLAPIDSNRMKIQQLSTVFEPEAWTERYYKDNGSPFPSFHNGLSNGRSNRLVIHNDYSTSPFDYASPGYKFTNTGEDMQSDQMFISKLMSMIPPGIFPPESPVHLSQKDEMRLLNILTSELYYADPLKLRDIYLDISNRVDKQLSGYCQYHDLCQTLSRVSFDIPPDLLQIVAALFVSTLRKTRDINYEKLLSFIGAALKNKDKIKPPNSRREYQLPRNNSTQTIKQEPVRYQPGSPFFGDGGETKLLRMVEEQLRENEFIVNLEQLMTSFQLEDRSHRGTLSADQIKNVCFKHRIPIQESLIRSLLQRCRENNEDGQYYWWTFVRLLEKAQPAKTNNSYPVSKQPLEQARLIPSSWNKSESRPQGHNSRSSWQNEDVHMNSPRKKEDASWFQNFMKYADALYRKDEKFEGSLPLTDVTKWTEIYNKTFQLDIPDSEINTALNLSTRKGNVDLHKFLSLLRKH